MNSPLNFFCAALTQASSASSLADLSEAELLALYPALATAATALFLAGLVCDLYLIARVTRALRASPAEETSLLRVDTKPWGMHEVTLAAAAIIGVLIVGSGLFAGTAYLLRLNESNADTFLLAGQAILQIGMLVAFILYFRRRNFDWRQVIGLRAAPPGGAITLGAISYLAILPPLAAVFAVYAKVCQLFRIKPTPQPIADFFLYTESPAALVLLVGFAIVIAPVFEEIFFRGFAYPALKQRWGVWPALMVVSVVFAMIHQHVPSIGPLFALSMGLGLAYEFTGSLLAPITMHALFNATNVTMLLYVRAHS